MNYKCLRMIFFLIYLVKQVSISIEKRKSITYVFKADLIKEYVLLIRNVDKSEVIMLFICEWIQKDQFETCC